MSTHGISGLTRVPVLAMALCVSLAACSDGTGPGTGEGQVEAVMHDHPGAAVVAPSAAPSYSTVGSSNSFDGSMSARTNIAIQAEGGAWIDLGSPREVSVSLQSTGDTTEVHGQASVPVGTYTRVRVTMRQASALVLSGSILGGVTINGNVMITMNGGSDVIIEKQITPFQVQADVRTQIIMDLNSEAWMTAQTAQSHAVSKAQIESAMAVTSRTQAQAGF